MSAVACQYGAIAAGHELTALAAKEILQEGGNAFDAIIAALATSCVVEPVLVSPGGGGFLMAHTAEENKTELVDFFVQTPREKKPFQDIDFREITADFGPGTQEFHIGRGATAAPGFIPGLFAIHERYASLPMAALLAPAVMAAETGFTLNPLHEFIFQIVSPIYGANNKARALYMPSGQSLRAGDLFVNKGLANFYKALSSEGLGFYLKGGGLDAMLQAQKEGGQLSAEDIAGYEVLFREPLEVAFKNSHIYLNPPPSVGGAFIGCALKNFEPLTGNDLPHKILKALTQTDQLRRSHKNDPAAMLTASGLDYPPTPSGPPSVRGTTHISIIDRHGNLASATGSNGEGNGHMTGEYGFMLNNMLGEEDLNPEGFHAWQENTRLSSMMCPSMIDCPENGLIALGSGGSNRIRSAIFQAIIRVIEGTDTPQDAVSAPRIHFENDMLNMEHGFMADIPSEIPDYKIWPEANIYYGGVHMVRRRTTGRFDGCGDPRRAGVFIPV